MTRISQLRLFAVALLVQARIAVGGRVMRLVGSLLAVEVRTIAAIGAAFRTEALLRGPGLDKWAILCEVFVTHKAPGMLVHFGKELLRHIGSKQPVAVLESAA
jgi:hypothetical protein